MSAESQGTAAPGPAGQTANLATFIQQMRYWANLKNPGVGYDQADRWNLKNGGSVDCSSFVILCLRRAGFQTGHASYTGDMRSELTKLGWAVKDNNGRPQAGDILLNDADHTAVYLGSGRLAQARINRLGGITGGTPGDQTNAETNVQEYYDYPWDCYLRYRGAHAGGPVAQDGWPLPPGHYFGLITGPD